jgi:hypothetical protein
MASQLQTSDKFSTSSDFEAFNLTTSAFIDKLLPMSTDPLPFTCHRPSSPPSDKDQHNKAEKEKPPSSTPPLYTDRELPRPCQPQQAFLSFSQNFQWTPSQLTVSQNFNFQLISSMDLSTTPPNDNEREVPISLSPNDSPRLSPVNTPRPSQPQPPTEPPQLPPFSSISSHLPSPPVTVVTDTPVQIRTSSPNIHQFQPPSSRYAPTFIPAPCRRARNTRNYRAAPTALSPPTSPTFSSPPPSTSTHKKRFTDHSGDFQRMVQYLIHKHKANASWHAFRKLRMCSVARSPCVKGYLAFCDKMGGEFARISNDSRYRNLGSRTKCSCPYQAGEQCNSFM